jgi:hypothetical protein
MSLVREQVFDVAIDGNVTGIYGDLASAKQAAISLAKGISSVKITSIGGLAPCSAWCWDYEANDWVFSQNAVLARPARKGEASS